MQSPTIQAALAAVMADVTHVGKEGKNSAQGYSFRGIDGVLNAVGPALRRHGRRSSRPRRVEVVRREQGRDKGHVQPRCLTSRNWWAR